MASLGTNQIKSKLCVYICLHTATRLCLLNTMPQHDSFTAPPTMRGNISRPDIHLRPPNPALRPKSPGCPLRQVGCSEAPEHAVGPGGDAQGLGSSLFLVLDLITVCAPSEAGVVGINQDSTGTFCGKTEARLGIVKSCFYAHSVIV